MGLHKLTAGDGYTYLTRQVAVHDVTDRGHSGLADYYAEKGESPGRWWGTGLAAVDVGVGSTVDERQMFNLFGLGIHPNAEEIEQRVRERIEHQEAAEAAQKSKGGRPRTVPLEVAEAERATRLGRRFPIYAGGVSEFQQKLARRYTAYNLERGEHWKTPVPSEVRAEIRTRLAVEMFVGEYGRPPVDDRERSGYLAKLSRQSTTAVAGYDLTFTPVKSVSVLWALAPREIATQVEAAHDAAVEHTLSWLEENVLFIRRGPNSAQQVQARGLLAAMFTHRDARSGDPNLHTHVAVSNKVQDETGRWRAIDGRVLYKAAVTCSETYNTRLEAELTTRLGVAWTERPTGAGKRPVREILGIDPRLAAGWSKRRSAIEARRRELAADFQARHGRPPTATESIALAQQATLETRQAKHAPRSEADQRTAWRAEAGQALGSAQAVDAMVQQSLARTRAIPEVDGRWVAETAEQVVAAVSADRATWQIWHLRAEAQRRARATGLALDQIDETVERVVGTAITDHCLTLGDPDPLNKPGATPSVLRRQDGSSVYTVHGAQQYTSKAIVDAEQRLVATAQTDGARRISDVRVGIAVAEAAANGVRLNAAQEAMVRELVTSGRRLQLVLAPAGTGKTTAMQVLARAWTDSSGTVIGLAPSAVAASELANALDAGGVVVPCETLNKLVWSINHPSAPVPEWVRSIDHTTMVIVDEAGMASTTELAAAIEFIISRGGVVRLVGDDRQLASVAAGGVLRDIATTAGAVTLTEVQRFDNPAEAAATLAIRDGDPAALGFYADHGRIHVGDLATAADQAYRAWATDVAAGKQAILVAPTRELVAELNTRARRDRLSRTPAPGPAVTLGDGTSASAGDLVITRRNDRRLRHARTDWVKNGDRWQVTDVHAGGSLTVRHQELRHTVTLPADYAAEHVQLGYASTIHGAQGTTVDTCHGVLTGGEARSLLYVMATRGREANHLYLGVGHDGDPHALIRPDVLIPPTALDLLTEILARDGAAISATTAHRTSHESAAQLRDAVVRYHDAVTFAAAYQLGEGTMTRLDEAADRMVTELTDAPAWSTLRSHLAVAALATGRDPARVLAETLQVGGLGDARDPAAVLDARLTLDRDGPLPWLPAIPAALAQQLDWNDYLTARSERVTRLAARVADEARAWTPSTAPPWAAAYLDEEHTDLRARLAIWRAVHDIPDNDERPTGPRLIGAPGDIQRDLDAAVGQVRARYPYSQRTWYQQLPHQVRTDPWVRPLCERLAHLERAGLPVHNYIRDALTLERQLPDEHAAAALWWRIAAHLGPATVHEASATADTLRRDWEHYLTGLLPNPEQIRSSPAWPALVAAVDDATSHQAEWTADQLLTTAATGLPSENLTAREIAEALVFRIAALTDPPEHEALPPPLEDELPPDDLDQIPAPAGPLTDALPRPDWTPTDAPPAAASRDALSVADRTRITDLNAAALEFYMQMYPRSWAPAYLTGRLHTDPTQHGVAVGYAPPGPTALIRHLTDHGASLEELQAAGLARHRERGDWVETFRDRLLFPIHHPRTGHVLGFVGRRNPTKTDDDFAGPKYLNTRTTDVFKKSEALYGYAESRAQLASGAIPVLVEGPLDAIAITLASNGTAVGIAPLGTALTDRQIQLLRPSWQADPTHIVIATDADSAEWHAAQNAYWRLTAAVADPQHLALPHGVDPAALLETDGPQALADALEARRPLAESIIDHEIDLRGPEAESTAGRLAIIRAVGLITAARPPEAMARATTRATQRLHLDTGVLQLELIDHFQERAANPTEWTRARLAEVRDSLAPRKPRRSTIQAIARPWRDSSGPCAYPLPGSLPQPSTRGAPDLRP